MSENTNTLATIAKHLALATAPLKDAVADLPSFQRFLYQLGWQVESLPTAFEDLALKVDELLTTVEGLRESPTPQEVKDLFQQSSDLYRAIQDLSPSDVPTGVGATQFLLEMGENLFQFLLTEYITTHLPGLGFALEALNILQTEFVPEDGSRPGYTIVKIVWSEIPEILKDPASLPERIYGWGTDDFHFERLGSHLIELMNAVMIPAQFGQINPELASGYQGDSDKLMATANMALQFPFLYANMGAEWVPIGVQLLELPGEDGKKPGVVLQPMLPSEAEYEFSLSDALTFRINAEADLSEMFGVLMRPGDLSVKYPFSETATFPAAGLSFTLDYEPEEPKVLLGVVEGTRLQLDGAEFSLSGKYEDTELEVRVGAELQGMKLVIAGGDTDGFLAKLLGGQEIEAEFPLGIVWSNKSGFHFTGEAGLDADLYPGLEMGPLVLERLRLALQASVTEVPGATLQTGVTLSGALGPFSFAVEEIGFQVQLGLKEGNSGPVDLSVGFNPPKGLALSIDAKVVTGGGYLFFDYEAGKYSGAMELAISDTIALKAIGILTTKTPDGSPGFSLLVLITAEFSPINIGMGFTLSGVGGLLAVNRTIDTDQIQAGLKDGNLKSILFPEDPVGNALQIISDLETIFPIEEGRFVFGPMGKIGWGSPTLIHIEMGLLLEVPNPVRLAIIGVLKAILPSEEDPIVTLQIAFLGVLDIEKKMLSFDASLFDSKILTFTLTGDMALRIKWGAEPNFLLSIGGFHPDYTPPPLDVPQLNRLALSIFDTEDLRVGLAAYIALTSNTVQFGARLDFFAKINKQFYIEGYLAFDALFQFSPFYFKVSFEAMLAIMKGQKPVLSIYLGASLEGPTPWRIQGRAEFKVLGIKLKASIDKTFGKKQQDSFPDKKVLPELIEALENPENWEARLPANAEPAVTYREPDSKPEPLLVDPGAELWVSQKVVPLGVKISKFGNQKPVESDPTFSITLHDATGTEWDTTPAEEFFAPAQFFALKEDQKLNGKSFEKYESGQIMAFSEVKTGPVQEKEAGFETIIIDHGTPDLAAPGFKKESATSFLNLQRNNAIAKSRKGRQNRTGIQLPQTGIEPAKPGYALASKGDRSAVGISPAKSLAEARDQLENLLRVQPDWAPLLQIIPQPEVNP